MVIFLFVWFDYLCLSVIKERVFLGWTSTKLGLMWLAQEHSTVTAVRLDPAAPQVSSQALYHWAIVIFL